MCNTVVCFVTQYGNELLYWLPNTVNIHSKFLDSPQKCDLPISLPKFEHKTFQLQLTGQTTSVTAQAIAKWRVWKMRHIYNQMEIIRTFISIKKTNSYCCASIEKYII